VSLIIFHSVKLHQMDIG